ncbi:efflux transporter outer membrane subunit [Flavobacterium sp. GA093]|uniref:Efflux transporter outer membrane subunit n=1 Tax=Flavobacterium hydrocarbonoxydans TaxID=2683249 RepID=A0A6I4NNS8_9FLAO|nr:efflux transporter outer membrane subunit [Flavobacterium hydrocarbonoxydans]MWB94215.1 efflux transporter outer membrane subunit [Flavobacterium hydrocarbonoxydans]
MTQSSNKYILVLITAAFLSACSVTKKYERPDTISTDKLYRDQASADSTTIATMPWQSVFKDDKLNALVQKGLDQNLNLKNAIENIVQARATLQQKKLAYYPTLNIDANATHNKQSEAGLNFPAGININTLTTTYKLGLSSSWEIDVWGKLSSSKRAALASYLATDAAKQAIQTQLIADIANNYFQLLSFDKQLEITEATLASRIKNVETIKLLKEGAVVTGAAVVQSEANQHAAEVLIPDLKRSIRETENVLNILMGQAPGPIERGKLGDQNIPENIALGVPSQLLNNRPDVRQAEFNFRTAFETTNMAKTYFYPSLTLTASTGFSNLELKDFFVNSVFYSIIGGLTQPIFNQGLNKARLTTAQSQQLQAMNNFQQTLLVAGQEVSNSLYSFQMAVEKEDSRAKQIAALEKAVDFTQQLLEYSSATNYTDVLTSQQNLLSAQLSGINDELQKLQALVDLYRALGGGWK